MTQLYTRRQVIQMGAATGLAVIVGGGLLEACSSAGSSALATARATAAATETTLQRMKRLGKATIGFSNEKPWYYNDPSGKLIGVSPDTIRYCLNQIGVPNIEGVLVDFSGLLPGLQAGRFDMTCSMNVLPARCLIAHPGDPETQTGIGLIVKKGNPKNLHSLADVAKSQDATVGAYQASTELKYAQDAGVPASRIIAFPDLATGIAGIESGRVDAMCDAHVAILQGLATANDPNLEDALPFTQPTDKNGKPIVDYGASYFRLADSDLRTAYNGVLNTIKANGQLLKIISAYGFTQEEVPPVGLTSDTLCSAS